MRARKTCCNPTGSYNALAAASLTDSITSPCTADVSHVEGGGGGEAGKMWGEGGGDGVGGGQARGLISWFEGVVQLLRGCEPD